MPRLNTHWAFRYSPWYRAYIRTSPRLVTRRDMRHRHYSRRLDKCSWLVCIVSLDNYGGVESRAQGSVLPWAPVRKPWTGARDERFAKLWMPD
ncbi:hypothetical protein IG631_17843 [Alternaria alternata]|nr:hypothetical protein IG631_17843 [Alternaria alternata]